MNYVNNITYNFKCHDQLPKMDRTLSRIQICLSLCVSIWDCIRKGTFTLKLFSARLMTMTGKFRLKTTHSYLTEFRLLFPSNRKLYAKSHSVECHEELECKKFLAVIFDVGLENSTCIFYDWFWLQAEFYLVLKQSYNYRIQDKKTFEYKKIREIFQCVCDTLYRGVRASRTADGKSTQPIVS